MAPQTVIQTMSISSPIKIGMPCRLPVSIRSSSSRQFSFCSPDWVTHWDAISSAVFTGSSNFRTLVASLGSFACSMVLSKWDNPDFRPAEVRTTGMPRIWERRSSSTWMPRFWASSIILTHRITLSVRSRICSVNIRFRSREFPSQTTTVQSAFPFSMYPAAICSSSVLPLRAYVPGRSTKE